MTCAVDPVKRYFTKDTIARRVISQQFASKLFSPLVWSLFSRAVVLRLSTCKISLTSNMVIFYYEKF